MVLGEKMPENKIKARKEKMEKKEVNVFSIRVTEEIGDGISHIATEVRGVLDEAILDALASALERTAYAFFDKMEKEDK